MFLPKQKAELSGVEHFQPGIHKRFVIVLASDLHKAQNIFMQCFSCNLLYIVYVHLKLKDSCN